MVTCIVQARMGSERLRGKVLKEIQGYPIILLTLMRLQKTKYIDDIILATSEKEEDTPLYELVSNKGFKAFRGEEDNVLKRYVDCVNIHKGDYIIRITGDCPLIDPVIVDHVISYFFMHTYDYVRLDVPNTFIRGFDVEIFTKSALFKTYELAEKEEYKEHVTYYMYTHPEIFRIGVVKGKELYQKNYRLCVDTMEDFILVEKVFNHFGDIYVSSKDVIAFLDRNPEIANLNHSIIQKNP